MKAYVITALNRGIPSLFADVKALYKDAEKRSIIEKVVEAHRAEFSDAKSDDPSHDPTAYLWTLYFLAQHYSHIHNHVHALSEGIVTIPT